MLREVSPEYCPQREFSGGSIVCRQQPSVYLCSGLTHSSLICLPWVLMAELLPKEHFAKVAVAIALIGGFLGSNLGSTSMGLASSFWGFGVVFWTIPSW